MAHINSDILRLGVDVGSTTVKAVALDPADNSVLFTRYQRHNAHQAGTVRQLLEEAAGGTLDLSQALRDPQRGALASYLGSGDPLRVDFSPEPVGLLRGDRVLLMTDGISGVLSQEEIGAAAKGSCQQIAQRLERAVLAKANPSQDNFTAIVAAYGR